jgi:hypothetical protein
MLPQSVTQEDLRRARSLQDELDDVLVDLAERIAGGAYVERGALAMCGSRVVWSETKSGIDRFRRFGGLLDAEDVQFFATDAKLATKFRRARARIFLTELRCLRTEIAHVFRARRNRIADSGKWTSYLALLQQTVLAYAAVAVLSFHGRLFYWNLPIRAGLTRSGSVVHRYLSFESPALDFQS